MFISFFSTRLDARGGTPINCDIAAPQGPLFQSEDSEKAQTLRTNFLMKHHIAVRLRTGAYFEPE
jgi:hypothetical protein